MTLEWRGVSRTSVLAKAFAALFFILSTVYVFSQAESATLSGTVLDRSGAVIVGARVQATNSDMNTTVSNTTNHDGIYVISGLKPGRYRMTVTTQGFKQVVVTDVVLNVQETVSRNFTLDPGAVSESVTVSADNTHVNTTDATVSTVVDRQFLQDIPLAGRSIQTLLMLTPGVVFTEGGATSSEGQFSVNGMRTDANYFTVDGVAANLGTDLVGNGLPEAAAGSSPGWNASGGTNSLVSLDSIQEFRVQTSSFAPEYGRTPGAQVGIVTRSGTNAWHGTAFDYLRNTIFDANDWFANHDGLAKAPERQNDFGGVLGGPIIKDKTFFFFSYEGLRLALPNTLEGVVPDMAARSAAPTALQPFLNAFPKPNGAELSDNLAQFNASVSNPVSTDAYSIRVDQSLGQKLRLFGRYVYSPSSTGQAGSPGGTGFTPNNLYQIWVTTHTATVGLDATLTNRINNELRLNYSNLKSYSQEELTTLGGAQPFTNAQLAAIYPAGVNIGTSQLGFSLDDASSYYFGASTGVSEQRQANLTDNISFAFGTHILKIGADYRWLAPFQDVNPYSLDYEFSGINGANGVLSGTAEYASTGSFQNVAVRSKNLSLYAQDTWKVNSRLTVTYGLRWDWNPPPTGANLQNDPYVLQGLNDPNTMTLAPRGTPFYQTRWNNFSPRIGVALRLFGNQDRGTVLRGGLGEFFDIGSGGLGEYTLGFPFRADNSFYNTPYPLTPAQLTPPVPDINARPVYGLYVADQNLKTPHTYQWNVALEQTLGENQTFTATYLGTLGRELLRVQSIGNSDFMYVSQTNNQGISNYQALQLQYQRNVAHGLQAIASYTWAHSIDNSSNDWAGYSPVALFHDNLSIDRANSDFDVRHNVSGALTYQIPGPAGHGFAHAVASGWSVQDLVVARTAFPIDLSSFFNDWNVGPYSFDARFNVVPGEPWYLYGNQYAGGKAINPAAFSDPPTGVQGDLGRNALRGFGAWQDNFAVHRDFPITERVGLQFRMEAFNIFNHPNFADPAGFWPTSFPEFGVSTSTLANATGSAIGGGLNPEYQIGAPRSFQFGLKLQF
ncbi:MAG TPA: carboxypeptidase regulatory-like domain-containing protein [Candidatus Koribacter sp.]